MKSFLVMVVFGVPAVLILLAISGDLTLSGPQEPPPIPAEEETEPPRPIMSADSPVQQKIFNWEYRHFDPELGVFDWLARGSEAVPGGGNKYDVVKPRIIFSTFTKTTPLREKTSTMLDAGAGRIEFGKEAFTANLSGGVTIISTDLLAGRGVTGTKLRTRRLDVRSANRRKGSDAAAAQISTTYPVHMTGPGFKLTAEGGMRGSTELNRVTFGPPIKMDLVTSGSGLFFGRKTARGSRIVKVTGGGPLLAQREPRRNVFSMSISGGVTVTDADISISCDTLDLSFGESGAVEAATASGDIVVREGGEVRLLAGRAKWDAKTGRTVLSGSEGVKFTQGNNVLVARTATLTEDRKRLLLEGGLEAWLEGTLARAGGGDGAGSFPRQWRVFCEDAEVHLSDDGDSLKPQSVEFRPAAGGEVLVRSADGTYRVTGGYVSYNAEKALVEIRGKPELRRVAESEWVRSERVWLNLKDGTVLFEDNVRASFKASGAAWKFKAGRMRANFELREGEDPAITSVTLTNPGGRVQLDYAPTDGAEIRMLAGRISWDATTRVAVLDSRNGVQLQRLQQAKDWIEARRITFEPRLKRALFEGGVRAHMEPEPAQAAPAGQAPKVEPPFELACDKFTLNFDDKYKTESALAEGEVKFTGSSNTLVLNCETARYVRGDRITFEGKARPELTAGANRLSARRIVVRPMQERIVFEGKVAGRFDDGKGAQMTMTCSEMVALYNPASGSITQVYFTEKVHIETDSARVGKTTLDGEQAVYEVEKALVSLTGDLVMIRRGSDRLREKKVVYDLKNRVLITGPTEKGYDWELDPYGWKKE